MKNIILILALGAIVPCNGSEFSFGKVKRGRPAYSKAYFVEKGEKCFAPRRRVLPKGDVSGGVGRLTHPEYEVLPADEYRKKIVSIADRMSRIELSHPDTIKKFMEAGTVTMRGSVELSVRVGRECLEFLERNKPLVYSCDFSPEKLLQEKYDQGPSGKKVEDGVKGLKVIENVVVIKCK